MCKVETVPTCRKRPASFVPFGSISATLCSKASRRCAPRMATMSNVLRKGKELRRFSMVMLPRAKEARIPPD